MLLKALRESPATAIFLFLLFCARAYAGADFTNITGDILYIRHLVNPITLENNENFYGTATLFRMDDTKAYFWVNTHVLESAPRTRDLRLSGAITNDEKVPFDIVGKSHGVDLGVVSIPRASLLPILADLFSRAILPAAYKNKTVSETNIASGLLGVRDIFDIQDHTLSHNYLSWEASLYEINRQKEIERLGRATEFPYRLLSAGMKATFVDNCPSYRLKRCLLVRSKSWGYSGGVYYQVPTAYSRAQIKGIISHYRFLMPETYVIPIDTALKIGNDLIDHHGKEEGRSDYLFEDDGLNSIKVKGGTLKDKVIYEGSDVAGGGGDVADAGGKTRHKLVNATPEITKYYDSIPYDLLKSVGFAKGFSSYLNYKPGIVVAGKRYQSLKTVDGELIPIPSLADFLRQYPQCSDCTLSNEFDKEDLPSILSSSVEYGMELRWSAKSRKLGILQYGSYFADHSLLSFLRQLDARTKQVEFITLPAGGFTQIGWQAWSVDGHFTSVIDSDTKNVDHEGTLHGQLYFDSGVGKYILRLLLNHTNKDGEEINEVYSLQMKSNDAP